MRSVIVDREIVECGDCGEEMRREVRVRSLTAIRVKNQSRGHVVSILPIYFLACPSTLPVHVP